MGEEDKTRRPYILIDGKLLEVTRPFEESGLPPDVLEVVELQDRIKSLSDSLEGKEKELDRLEKRSKENSDELGWFRTELDLTKDELKCALRRLHWYMSRPPRWRVFAYLDWIFSNPRRMEELYFHASYYKESMECSDKRLRDIFRKYGYSEKLLRK